MTSDERLAAALDGASMAGTTTGRRCKVGRILDDITPANRTRLVELLAGTDRLGRPTVSSDRLAKQLAIGGVPVSANLIRSHRRGDCPCPTRKDDAA